MIIAGHARFLAAKALHIDSIPAIRIENLTEDQIRAYTIADNKLTELGEWDYTKLSDELEYLNSVDIDAMAMGFDYEDFEMLNESFQNDDEVRIFLISLKAGGVGLNLTAADYVYIVDPWWNPAVEQQAIDRTHRIGQTKNIFAYRMICKDTIEDKILQLQDKKRSLARDLVADDTGFVKTLTREDVEYLFS